MLHLHKKRTHRRILAGVVIGTGIFLGIAIGIAFFSRSFLIRATISSPITERYVEDVVGSDAASLLSILPDLLGITKPQTYLLLFLNDTELRPGGGFIGSYGVVRVAGGQMQILDSGGSESLAWRNEIQDPPKPPQILTDTLGVPRWYFRDSNWSPDWSENAERAVAFYRLEEGAYGGEFDGVFGITTHVLEELLEITGPITVQGITFTPETAVETLQYEVEYGFADEGIPFADRKQLLTELFQTIVTAIQGDIRQHTLSYLRALVHLAEEKHIQLFLTNPAHQSAIIRSGYAGSMDSSSDSDYLLYIDANLAALKTDHAISRSLSYSLAVDPDGVLLPQATVRMTYVHSGIFDWRTTRYKTYVRIFVPKGSVLSSIRQEGTGKDIPFEQIDQGVLFEKQWFGVYISIEPQRTDTLTISYTLPEYIRTQIADGTYELRAQKQAGTDAIPLSLDLDFGRPLVYAEPTEDREYWGDTRYTQTIPLRTDLRVRTMIE